MAKNYYKTLKRVIKFQTGGAMPSPETAPAEAVDQTQATAEASQNPVDQVKALVADALQNQNCDSAMQACQILNDIFAKAEQGAQPTEEAQPETSPEVPMGMNGMRFNYQGVEHNPDTYGWETNPSRYMTFNMGRFEQGGNITANTNLHTGYQEGGEMVKNPEIRAYMEQELKSFMNGEESEIEMDENGDLFLQIGEKKVNLGNMSELEQANQPEDSSEDVPEEAANGMKMSVQQIRKPMGSSNKQMRKSYINVAKSMMQGGTNDYYDVY